MVVKDHEDRSTHDQLEDKNQDVSFKNNISEVDRCNQELEETEVIEDKQSCPKVQTPPDQLETQYYEVITKMATYETSVVQLEDNGREVTEQMQSSVTKNGDLLHQSEKNHRHRREEANATSPAAAAKEPKRGCL